MKNNAKPKAVEAHLKIHLLKGKSITHNEALILFSTNRLAEYIRRLRNSGMKIKTEMVYNGRDTYGRYYLERKPKESRISNRAYMDQAYRKI